MSSACIAAKNEQGAFLFAEKRAGRILGNRETGRAHFGQQTSVQGAAPSYKCLGETLG